MHRRIPAFYPCQTKPLLSRCLLLLTLVFFAPILAWADSTTPFGQGRLFTVTSADGRVSHIFGTMHSDDPAVLDLPEAVRTAFAESTRFVMEINIDSQTSSRIYQYRHLDNGLELSGLVGQALYQEVLPALKQRGLEESQAKALKPWAAALVLSLPKITNPTLDVALMKGAYKYGKPVFGLESVSEQLQAFDQLSVQEQTTLLKSALKNQAANIQKAKEFQSLYLAGDLAALLAASKDHSKRNPEERAVMKKLNKALLYQRNRRMAKRVQAHLTHSGAFIAIGALHLPGTNGVLNMLERFGFDIEPH